MIVGSISENRKSENRVAITPDIVKKYKSLNIKVFLSKDYAKHLGILDKDYEREGANFLESDEEIISKSNAILQLNILSDENLDKLHKDQNLIGVLNPFLNENKFSDLLQLLFRDQNHLQRFYTAIRSHLCFQYE